MGLINDFIGFLIDRRLKEDEPKQMPDKGVEQYMNQDITSDIITVLEDLDKRVKVLEEENKQLKKRVYLPSERSHTKQSECSKLNLRSEWESRNFFE